MKPYNLVYFPVRARAETIRVLLHFVGVPFTEENYWVDDWPDFKTSGRCPTSQIPVLEMSDGRRLAQSRAIIKYLAKEHGVAPASNYEQARADMLTDTLKDMEDRLAEIPYEEDQQRKASMTSKFFDQTLPVQTTNFNKILQDNQGGKGYLIGEKISYADIDFFSFFNGWIGDGKLEVPEQLKEYPLLVDLYNKVMNEPKIMEYLKHRKPDRMWTEDDVTRMK